MKDNIFLKIDGLAAGYGRKPLIEDISLELEKGQILTLIGPNGSGKSTILKTITRQLKAIDGIVTIDGSDIFRMHSKELARQMSVVLTQRIETELMTCRDVVAMGRYPYTDYFGRLSDEDNRIVESSLKRVHALELADVSFNEISDGQRQRIMLARAICQQPDVMILDEPTSYLDIRHKVILLDILRNMSHEDGITVIMSLHEIDLAGKISDMLMCVDENHKVRLGTAREIFANDTIQKLYGIEGGSYDAVTGGVELAKPCGSPDILVIGGNGSGIPVYRKLQRKGIPFYAGVLYENDIDYRVAKALAADVISQKAFVPVSKNTEEKAYEVLNRVSAVVDCGCEHGEYDRINTELLKEAVRLGKKYNDIWSIERMR